MATTSKTSKTTKTTTTATTKRLNRTQAIRAKCIDCCGNDRKEVKLCPITHCPLWIYRLGHEVNPDGTALPKKPRNRSKNEG